MRDVVRSGEMEGEVYSEVREMVRSVIRSGESGKRSVFRIGGKAERCDEKRAWGEVVREMRSEVGEMEREVWPEAGGQKWESGERGVVISWENAE